MPLTFSKFQATNHRRCDEGFNHKVDDWDLPTWALAIAGESGELCNLLKKVVRGDFTIDQIVDGELIADKVAAELADIITYCDLAMTRLGRSTDFELIKKFNQVSHRRAVNVYLTTDGDLDQLGHTAPKTFPVVELSPKPAAPPAPAPTAYMWTASAGFEDHCPSCATVVLTYCEIQPEERPQVSRVCCSKCQRVLATIGEGSPYRSRHRSQPEAPHGSD